MLLILLFPFMLKIITKIEKIASMLKLRLKRGGRKRQPAYRVVLMKSDARREGQPVESLGYYKPISKEFVVNAERIKIRLEQGAKPTNTVRNLLIKSGIIESHVK